MKDRKTAGLLAIFLGGIGIQFFYLGNMLGGILSLIFCWTGIPAVIGIIHGISIFRQNEGAFNEEYNKEYVEKKKKEKYGGLIECDALKEKGLITKEEYKERVENVKAEIQRLEEEEKEMRIGKEEELKKIEKSKGIIIFFAVVVGLLLLLGILAIFFLKE